MEIHEQIQKDSYFINDLKLSQLRMMPDGENPWFILIPLRENKKDWSDLSLEDQYLLCEEINLVSDILKAEFKPDKINVASLGNMVSQLHIHVIARYQHDRAWPSPIWGSKSTKDFDQNVIEKMKTLFSS